MKKIDGSNWLRKPWKRMSHNDYYRYYVKRTEECEYHFTVIRTSDKCYRCTRWTTPFVPFMKSTVSILSCRSWREVEYFADNGVA